MRWKNVLVAGGGLLLGIIVATLAAVVAEEAHTSRWQAQWLSRIASELGFELRAGPSEAIRFPEDGPFDRRLGYQRLPGWMQRLQGEGFEVAAQAQWTPRLLQLTDLGLFPPYHEKTRAGLELRDCRNDTLYRVHHPERAYESYAQVPRLLRDMLLFIENRKLFASAPTRNPAIEWARLARATVDQLVSRIISSHEAAGGSTLATQIEKYRHSPGGLTNTPRDKLLQIGSASLRSYLDGPDTRPRRQQIVLDYLNTVPLSASSGYGEVIGIGDALWVWYGRDFAEVNRLLREASAAGNRVTAAQALAVKQALSLLVSQRRPSHYLGPEGAASLRALTNNMLRLLADAGVITVALRDAALPQPLQLRRDPPPQKEADVVHTKATNALRTRLLELLELPGAYDLDRLDLRADSTFAGDVQRRVTQLLRSLGTPAGARAAGLYGASLLRPGDDPSRISYSFTLFETSRRGNLLRVQTDNRDQPFDLNEGARLDLGSTSKLRTLATYLQQVAALHRRWQGLSAEALAAEKVREDDPISQWARGYLASAGDRSLAAMLEAAMNRTYSADPGERFLTGGGVHTFGNFSARDNGQVMNLYEALTRSVNLPFIRLMRDVVRHVIATDPAMAPEILDDVNDPRRRQILARFADEEGSDYMRRFYRRYAPLSPQGIEARLAGRVRQAAVPMANAFFSLYPQGTVEELQAFLARWLSSAADSAGSLHAKHGPGRWTLPDRGYLARVHPLELWVAGYLRTHPGAGLGETLAAGAAQRQEAYGWLFRTSRKSAQDRRIRQQLEERAFDRILQAWRRLGYPFETITPSYATALGASGDRPAALAELAGIISNDGLRLPMMRFENLVFANGTPYETHFERQPRKAERVMAPEVAQTLRRALRNVVEQGTARRAAGAVVTSDGTPIPLAGKTGTGDHRFEVRGAGGALVSSRVVNRTASFVFLVGERYYGTVMAYVHEPHAEHYAFTSALPTQVLKALGPALAPLVSAPGCAPNGTAQGQD